MYYDLWPQYIQVRKLFKGGNYSRKYGIHFSQTAHFYSVYERKKLSTYCLLWCFFWSRLVKILTIKEKRIFSFKYWKICSIEYRRLHIVYCKNKVIPKLGICIHEWPKNLQNNNIVIDLLWILNCKFQRMFWNSSYFKMQKRREIET